MEKSFTFLLYMARVHVCTLTIIIFIEQGYQWLAGLYNYLLYYNNSSGIKVHHSM